MRRVPALVFLSFFCAVQAGAQVGGDAPSPAAADLPPGAEKRMMLPAPEGKGARPLSRLGRGFWYHGRHDHRAGWWWRSGDEWFFYGTAADPFPEIYGRAGSHPGSWSWCEAAGDFYPFVTWCPSGWRAVKPR